MTVRTPILSALIAIASVFAAFPTVGSPVAIGPDPLEPAGTGGIATVDRALAKLSTHRRLLVVGAHPDDEDTGLLALVATEMAGEAAYLSLSRGDGGQNLIGPQLGVGLGLLRSGELMAARKVEGGRQYFTRAYDFGYTRSLDETLARWPIGALREDAVRTARRFLPQVVVSVFPDDGRGGHGQHQAAGRIAHELPGLAADASMEVPGEDLPVWKIAALYRKTWWDPEATTVEEPLGGIDAITGRSVRQLAAASRSRHRSQDMGRLEELGGATASAAWVAGTGEGGDRLFSGVDTRLAAIGATVEDEAVRARVEAQLAEIESSAREARRSLSPVSLASAVPTLASAVRTLRSLEEELAGAGGDGSRAALRLIREKRGVAEAGLAAALGVAVDATTEVERLPSGSSAVVELALWNSGSADLRVADLLWVGAAGWSLGAWTELGSDGEPIADGFGASGSDALTPGTLRRWRAEVTLDEGAAPTVPYFLRRPLDGDLYDWSVAAPEDRGEPFESPPLHVAPVLVVETGGVETTFPVPREVVFRTAAQEIGEIRRPIVGVPSLEVEVSPDLWLWSLSGASRRSLAVRVSSNMERPVRGRVLLDVPADWPMVPPVEFEIREPRGEAVVEVSVERPQATPPDMYQVRARAVDGEGRSFDRSYDTLDYEHVRPRLLPRPAVVEAAIFDVALPSLASVAYLRGASDRIPEALLELGLPLEVLDPGALATLPEDRLDEFDAVVVGPRAYETEPELARANGRLLDYARRGGLLLVQYQQYQFVSGGFAPFELDITRPHDRVTDESSPVVVVEPGHPVLRHPNPIGPTDWNGWVQERGLYFANSWDDAYRPLLELVGPEGEPLRGGLLVAPLGEGTYVYTGLAFFRQLPAGVGGALRLFANLLALAEEDNR